MIYLFNFLKEGEKISKYKEIEKIYNIINITDNYIIFNNNNIIKKAYLYKICPTLLINKREDEMEALLYNYKEIISIIDFDFQILIKNSEFNVDKYIQKITKNIKEENIKKSELFNKYIANLKVNLEKEKMYDMSYYIIVIDTGKINFLETVDSTFKKFKKLGCEAIRISSKSEISDILNYFINREKEVLANEF